MFIRRGRALVFVAAALGLAPRAGAQSLASLTQASKVSIDSGDGRVMEMTMRIRLRGDLARMDLGGPMAEMMPGMFQLMNLADKSMTSVMPSQNMAMSMPASFSAPITKITADAKFVGTPSIKVDELGPGEPLLGHATRRIRTTVEYTLTFPFPGTSCTSTMKSVTEDWITSELPPLPLALRNGLMGRGVGTSDQGAQRELMDRIAALQKGVSLRSIAQVSLPTGKTMTMKSDATEWSTAPIDSAVFAIPSGIQVMDVSAMGAPDPSMLLEMSRKQLCNTPAKP